MSFFGKLKSFFHNTGGSLVDRADVEKHEVERLVKAALETEVAKQLEHMGADAAKAFVGKVLVPVAAEIAKPMNSEFGKVASHLLEEAAPTTHWLTVGVFTFTINDGGKKVEQLNYWRNHIPQTVDDLKKLVKDLEPEDIEIALKVNVPGLPFGIGDTLVYLKGDYEEKLEKLWNAVNKFVK